MCADLAIGIEILGIDKFSSVGKGITGTLGGLFEGASKLGMGVFGIGQLAQGIGGLASGMIAGNAQMETYQSQLETLMGSADGARERIAQLAKIGADTPFELPELVQSEKIMMGFGLTTDKTMKLTGKSLDEFRTSIGDMAAGTGTDLGELTNLWGKFGSGATGEAISRMQELGIVTREQLTEVGVQFDKSGALLSPLPQAMEAAMKIADSKFGGGMQKLSLTFEGQMSTLADSFNQAKTAIMAPIFDVLKNSLVGLNAFLSSDAFKNGLQAITEFMTGAVKGGIGLISKGFNDLSDALGGLVGLDLDDYAEGWDTFSGALARVGEVLEPLTTIFSDAFSGLSLIVQQGLGGDMESAFANFGDLLNLVTLRIGDVLTEWGAAFVEWIGPIIPPLLRELLALVIRVDTWIVQTGLPMLIQALADWAGAFIDWIGPLIPPLLRELGGMLLQVGSWMLNTALPAMVGNLLKWGLAFVEWVAPRIPQLMGEVMKLELELLGWIVGTALPAIASKLVEWGGAFVDWVTKPLQELPGKLAMLLNVISQWATDSLNSVAASAASLGAGFVQGIQDGIAGAIDGLRSWITDNLANALPQWVRTVLGISSPSSVFADIGSNIVAGLEVGMKARFADTQGVVGQLMKGLLDSVGVRSGAVQDYIANVAASLGIDPRVALAVAASEGGFSPSGWIGDHGSSFGPYQLHYGGIAGGGNAVGGMGDSFTRDTGLFAGDFDTWPAQVRYALEQALRGGWGPWHGYPGGQWDGIEGRMLGGSVNAGQTYLVGERGPELLHMGGPGHVSPGGGGTTYVFNFPNYLGSRDELVRQIESGLALKKGSNGRLAFER